MVGQYRQSGFLNMNPILEEPSTGTGRDPACDDYRLLIIGCCSIPK
jgi:hypothetical protein